MGEGEEDAVQRFPSPFLETIKFAWYSYWVVVIPSLYHWLLIVLWTSVFGVDYYVPAPLIVRYVFRGMKTES